MARVVGKRDQAAGLKWLVQALEANPKSPEVAEELAQLGIELAEYDVAVRALRILTGKDFDPQVRARAYLGQAEIAMLQDNKARALVLARKAQTESPELAEVGALLRKLGRA
jgi:tetratricopeptide (TPR) repeat protein